MKTIPLLAQPNQEMIQTIIGHAIQTPSGDNAQPWKFVWANNKLLILHSETLGKHTLNRHNHASMIALGTVLESIRLSATQFGFATKVKHLFKQNESLSLWAEVTFSQQRLLPDLLFQMISVRGTDRREFKNGRLDQKITEQLAALQKEFSQRIGGLKPELHQPNI